MTDQLVNYVNCSALKMARKIKGMTQQEVADAADISMYTISRVENGNYTTKLSVVTLKLIADAVSCPMWLLFTSNRDMALTEKEKALVIRHRVDMDRHNVQR